MTGSLCQLGYTDREAEFLIRTSLSGYFLRNQFNTFIGRECGALGQRFIERSIQLGHVTPILGYSRQLLYHVSARAFYALLGEGDNRNRREHRPETMRHRLMILDYVIARLAENWLLTDDARRQAFSRLRGAWTDAGRQAQNAGVFHKAWRQPVSLDGNGLPRFAFVDAGVGSFSEWEEFLRARRSFLKDVGQASVVYASYEEARFRPAQRLFRRIAVGEAAGGEVDRERLRVYFHARQLFEKQRYEEFDQARLDQLREDRRVYTGAEFEQLYTHWRQAGDAALVHITGSPLQFETRLLPQAYAWLNPIRIRERRAHHGPDTRTTKENS